MNTLRTSVRVAMIAIGLAIPGCSSEPPATLEAVAVPPETGKASYWLAKPAAASVFGDNYDTLWIACQDVARGELFELDRQDYREGILMTRPLISKQFFEFWRPDTGDAYGVLQNSLQATRRTIEFQFDKLPGGYTVSPKVVVERFARQDKRVTTAALYQEAIDSPADTAHDKVAGAQPGSQEQSWYAVGRDLEMEANLAKAIKGRIQQ